MVRKTQVKSESPIFLKGVYFRHYEDMIEFTGKEDSDLKELAYRASRTGVNYHQRVLNVQNKLIQIDLTDAIKREYVTKILHSLESGISDNIRVNEKQGNQKRLNVLRATRENLGELYFMVNHKEHDTSMFAVVKEDKVNNQYGDENNLGIASKSLPHKKSFSKPLNSLIFAGTIAYALLFTGCKNSDEQVTLRPKSIYSQEFHDSQKDKIIKDNIAIFSANYEKLFPSANKKQNADSNMSASFTLNQTQNLGPVTDTFSPGNLRIIIDDLGSKVNSSNVTYSTKIAEDNQKVISVDLPSTNSYVFQTNSSNNSLIGKVSSDIDKYRVYSLNEGSRVPLESLVNTRESALDTGNSLIGAVSLSYGNNKFQDLREDDLGFKKSGKGFFKSLGSFFKRLGGPLSDKHSYSGLNLVTGAIAWPSRIITGAVDLGKNTANVATAGMANNLIDPVFQTGKDTLETGKHLVQSGLNLTRVVVKPLPTNAEEFGNKMIDWVDNVPTEFASNVIGGEGFSNAENMQGAVSEKGNTGTVAEFGASAFLLGKTIDNMYNKDTKSLNGGGRNDDPGVGNGGGGRTSGPGVGVKP